MTRITVVYYSSTGNVHQLAEAIAEGAGAQGAEVRLRRAAELAPDAAIDANPAWRQHLDATRDIPVATPDDLAWSDGYAFGSPSRFGAPAAQLKQFIDTLGGTWARGDLADRAATVFTSAQNAHGGQEAVSLSLFATLSHFGAIIVPPGYTDASIAAAGGNPYGISVTSGAKPRTATDADLAAARYQGGRLARVAGRLAALRDTDA
ncbi:NAD(P)H:quinone oxidoreductase [Microbacterium sp. No. 7]|uniref:NAD(P)H:quinone oxidoreductase n=1 Tax=Microbacterium sp. No. 7 TaxID=1714373 RepID=UPI0006D2C6A7|nr:NAD(P)H:quinone oxidoreductase [Microbacterium sp. No. 7]ALJ18467.1 NAD(P)H dehydrogenase [Microbacterium sp. No. 7]